MIGKAIYSLLSTDTPTTNVVGSRIYAEKAPQEPASQPYLVIRRRATGDPMHATGSAGIRSTRFAVLCWGDSHADVTAVADAVRNKLKGYRGTAASVVVRGVFIRQDQDNPDPPFTADELGKFGRVVDVECWHVE